ncbi:MAG TPA: NADP-dependent oxidoreductase [Vicinamibacterales bacterium]|nr:NADP-dependent oxidoreductase [Vicinamibacterales bacterium]
MTVNRQIRLKSRPVGAPAPADFDIADAPLPPVGAGGVLRRTIYLSLDPYMRGRMSDAKSYAPPVAIGDVMVGHTVSQVIDSHNAAFAPGDFVAGYDGWQQFAASDGRELRKLDPALGPISTAIGVLGMPGLTAWIGLMDIGKPRAGETVVVSAASGAVGSVVGQLAKAHGCRAVGVAGSDEKCRYVTDALGFDACVNYRTGDLVGSLRTACRDGIDVYFENVGGAVFAAVLQLINRGARIPLCGLISDYNATMPEGAPNLRPILVNRALMQGFIVSDYADRFGAALQELAPLVRAGRIKYREDIVEGIDAAPGAFIGLLEGRNFGKALVRVAPDPTR